MSAANIESIALPAHFSQVQLSGLKDIVNHHHEDGHRVQFDASEVERVDGAAVQFLLAVSKLQASSGDADAVIVNTNEVLLAALQDLGVEGLIPYSDVEEQDVTTQA